MRYLFPLYHRRCLLLCLFLLLAGCTAKESDTPIPTPNPSPVATEKPSEPPPASPTDNGQATASTKIFDRIPARTNNLKLAIAAIDGTILEVDETFSFNETVGDRTEEKGYQKAIGYDEHGEKQPTVGGGICQISSTLYMAAKNGNFEIVERHSHSHEVPYADSDNDATVSYGGYDLKFKNTRDKPVKIELSTDEESVSAKITELEK
ncbi:MAG: VanW family protein [Clostridia bacterium]|nr:VanW family protein [Clostridia bacterium]